MPLSIPPDSGTVDWTFVAPDGTSTSDSCTLGAGGLCTVEQNSASFGTGTLTATALDVVYGGDPFGPVDLTAEAPGQSSSLAIPVEATKIWVGYELTLDPPDSENVWPTEQDHVVTLQLDRFPAVPQLPIEGQDIDVTLTSTVATITRVSDGSFATETATCTTDATGACQVTITATGAGGATVSASYTTQIGQTEITYPALDDADKTWVTYRVTVDPPTAENLVDTEHVVTVTVEADRGTGFEPVEGAEPDVTTSGVGQITDDGCSTGTAADGTCTVTIRSATPGTTEITAEHEGTAASGGTGTFSATASKTWLDHRLAVDPQEATNRPGEPHTFVATLEENRGGGFSGIAGGTLIVATDGTGGVVSIDPTGAGDDRCVTDSSGTCRITVNSSVDGSLTITVNYEAQVGGIARTYTFTARKSWVGSILPATGSGTQPFLRIGAGVLLAGLLFVLVSLRRRTPAID